MTQLPDPSSMLSLTALMEQYLLTAKHHQERPTQCKAQGPKTLSFRELFPAW